MMTSSEDPSAPSEAVEKEAGPGPAMLSGILPQIFLAQAARMARAGKYSEAELLLAELSAEDRVKPIVSDLQARICAQQGQLKEAEELWGHVLQQVPTSKASQDAIHRIEKLRRRPKWLAPGRLALVVVVFAVFLTVLLEVRTAVRRRTPVQTKIERHAGTLPKAPEKLPVHEAAKAPAISVSGMAAQSDGAETVAIFESGLFRRGAKLLPEARTTLANLGQELQSHSGVSVILAGCTDDRPVRQRSRYHNNIALRIARANAVFQYLTDVAGLEEGMFSLESSPAGPYPNDTPDNRAKNRTVIVRIVRRSEADSNITSPHVIPTGE